MGGLFPTPLFRRLERSPIQFPIILAFPRRVRDGSGPKFVIFWLSRGVPFWAPLRALLRALNSTIFNKFEKHSLLHKICSILYNFCTSLHKKEALDFTKLLKTFKLFEIVDIKSTQNYTITLSSCFLQILALFLRSLVTQCVLFTQTDPG